MNKNKLYYYIVCILSVLFTFIAYDLVDNYKFYLKMKQFYENKVDHPLIIRGFETNLEPLLKNGLRVTYSSSQKHLDYFSSNFLQTIIKEVQEVDQKTLDTALSQNTYDLIRNIYQDALNNETEVRMRNIIEYLTYNSDNILEEEDYQNIVLFYQTYLSFIAFENTNPWDKEQSLDALQFCYFNARFFEMMLQATNKSMDSVDDYGYTYNFNRPETSIKEFQTYIKNINKLLSEDAIVKKLMDKYGKEGLE